MDVTNVAPFFDDWGRCEAGPYAWWTAFPRIASNGPLGVLGVATPPIYGLTSEEVRERGRKDAGPD